MNYRSLHSALRQAIPLLLLAGCASASNTPAVPDFLNERGTRAELLLLGVFHFADPGLDAYKPRFTVDIRSPKRQLEVEDVVNRLTEFRPTKIALEWRTSDQPRADSLYRAYLAGTYELGTNEVYQLGFRLAKKLGHSRVYLVDAPGRAYLSDAEGRAQAASLGVNVDSALNNDPWDARFRQLYAYDDSLKSVMTLRSFLAYINTPQRLRKGHGHYAIGSFKLDKGDNYVGVDDATQWYNRNLRIFNNVQRITDSTAERILVIIGAGHLPILRFVAEASPEYRLREVSDFLGR